VAAVHEALHLPAHSSSPRRARQFVDQILHQWHRDGAIDRLALIASELVTNAVRHAQTEITIELTAEDGAVHLEVFDRGAGKPVFLDSEPSVPGGLGLPIVEALASSWGMRDREGGKGVWAEVRG
jgi:anti-sigma regulatory factor (Ser/Thr protein kinase)